MPNHLGRIALVATLLAATPVSAAEEDGQAAGPVYARPGFYLGVGGSSAFPMDWNGDVDDRELSDEAAERANQNAAVDLDGINPNAMLLELETVVVDGADLEDVLLGVNAVVGYRVAETVAFEVEAEWLFGSNKSSLDVAGSMGSHSIEVEEIWTLTANARMFLPTDWWVQPSAIVGLGLQHSKLKTDIVTSGVMTTNTTGTIPVDADFRIQETDTKLDGALRVGAGIDVYVTPNIVGQLNATYVMPFADVGRIMGPDYISLVWRLVYRF